MLMANLSVDASNMQNGQSAVPCMMVTSEVTLGLCLNVPSRKMVCWLSSLLLLSRSHLPKEYRLFLVFVFHFVQFPRLHFGGFDVF